MGLEKRNFDLFHIILRYMHNILSPLVYRPIPQRITNDETTIYKPVLDPLSFLRISRFYRYPLDESSG